MSRKSDLLREKRFRKTGTTDAQYEGCLREQPSMRYSHWQQRSHCYCQRRDILSTVPRLRMRNGGIGTFVGLESALPFIECVPA
jgi:hypothetical protein